MIFQYLGFPGVSSRQTDGQEGRFGARVGEPDLSCSRYQAQDSFRPLYFKGSIAAQVSSLSNLRSYSRYYLRVGMSLKQGSCTKRANSMWTS